VTNASAHGIASTINTRPGRDNVTVVGYDLVHDNISELQKGTIDCILSQRQDLQGYRGIYQLYSKIVLGQEVDSTIEMPIDIYLKENLMQEPFVEFENSIAGPGGASPAGLEKIAQ
jgi:ABC-type sugar transport system substrate-binding protein